MLKKMILSTVIYTGLFFSMQQGCIAQVKTIDELKAEREVLKSELKSQKALERKEKFEKLKTPKKSKIASVDDLAINSTVFLLSAKDISAQVPELYKRTIGENVDGVTDLTVKKPTLDELVNLGSTIATQIKAVSGVSSSISSASADIKSASVMKAPKATKSLNYTKQVIELVGPELQMNLKVVNNLIATLKSAKNY